MADAAQSGSILAARRGSGRRLVWVVVDPGRPWTRGTLLGIREGIRDEDAIDLQLVYPREVTAVPAEVAGCVGLLGSPAFDAFLRDRPGVSMISHGALPAGRRVYTDPASGAAMAVSHFLDRDIRHLCTHQPGAWPGARGDRAQAFADAALEAGATVSLFDAEKRQRGRPRAPAGGIADWIRRQPRPLGILAADDWMALRLVEGALAGGLRVPDEVAVLGHNDDERVCSFSRPTISSIIPALRLLGTEAVRLLIRLMDGETTPERSTVVAPLGVNARESTDVHHAKDPLVADALTYIRDHLQDGVSQQDVVGRTGLSISTLNRRFRSQLGDSAPAVIRRKRLERVKQLLRSSDSPLVEVALDAGYDHVSQMCRVFKKEFGLTPTEFRRSTLDTPAPDLRS